MPTRGRLAVLGWELAGIMEHQIVASGRGGGNPCFPVRFVHWQGERGGTPREVVGAKPGVSRADITLACKIRRGGRRRGLGRHRGRSRGGGRRRGVRRAGGRGVRGKGLGGGGGAVW